jgi:hypothetical protein
MQKTDRRHVRPMLEGLEAGLGIKIHQVDVYGLVEQVLADPGAFGITDVADQAKSGDEATPVPWCRTRASTCSGTTSIPPRRSSGCWAPGRPRRRWSERVAT